MQPFAFKLAPIRRLVRNIDRAGRRSAGIHSAELSSGGMGLGNYVIQGL
jgi:hypothetical protein